jgi:histidyl-tRNA synthetase
VERMLLAAGEPAAPAEQVDLFIALAKPDGAGTGFELSRAARRAGLSAQLELAGRSLKGQLKHADRIGARYVAIVGDDGGHVSLKDMQSGQQQELDAADVVRAVRKP